MEIPQGARKTKMEMETRTIYLALALALALLIGEKTSGHPTADEVELQSNPKAAGQETDGEKRTRRCWCCKTCNNLSH
ncbi:unnamed protein product [Miscanthus lutarioriparius]|uniref:Uncharacterized protein n=1 Tax=Miscanthus lutarioriparius TaxID=422564 RepID=A0A811NAE7_9POAL|nr:unnamed protein product [Miscanthus lutarioriparius]